MKKLIHNNIKSIKNDIKEPIMKSVHIKNNKSLDNSYSNKNSLKLFLPDNNGIKIFMNKNINTISGNIKNEKINIGNRKKYIINIKDEVNNSFNKNSRIISNKFNTNSNLNKNIDLSNLIYHRSISINNSLSIKKENQIKINAFDKEINKDKNNLFSHKNIYYRNHINGFYSNNNSINIKEKIYKSDMNNTRNKKFISKEKILNNNCIYYNNYKKLVCRTSSSVNISRESSINKNILYKKNILNDKNKIDKEVINENKINQIKDSEFLNNNNVQNIKYYNYNNIKNDNNINNLKNNKKKKLIVIKRKNKNKVYKYNIEKNISKLKINNIDNNRNYSLLLNKQEKVKIGIDKNENKNMNINFIKDKAKSFIKNNFSFNNTNINIINNYLIKLNDLNELNNNNNNIIYIKKKNKSFSKLRDRHTLKAFDNKRKSLLINSEYNKESKLKPEIKSSRVNINNSIFNSLINSFSVSKMKMSPNISIYRNKINVIKKSKSTKLLNNELKNKFVNKNNIHDTYLKSNKLAIEYNLEENNGINNANKNINFLKESQNLLKYIKKYYSLNNEYPNSDISFYKFGRIIGRGAYGKVNLGLHILTGKIVAIKSFNKTKFSEKKTKNQILNEINIMKKLNHHSIVKILDTIETEKYILLIMENISGGDLLSYIRKWTKLSENIVKYIFKQLLISLKYIHSKNIVHRDIKLDNILLDISNKIKICDFGVSKIIQEKNKNILLYEQCGTPGYIAPEIISEQGYVPYPVDIWSAGVVLYSLLKGKMPFKAQNLKDLYKKILSFDKQYIEGVSKNANDLIYKLMEKNPNKRFNIDDALNHPWFNEDNFDENNIKLFTKAEIAFLSKNKVDYRYGKNSDLIENFNIDYLDTNNFNNKENNNCNTKSDIFAPFNSSFGSDNNLSGNIKIKLEDDLDINNNLMLFTPNVDILNRKYELNNNGEIDHGIIINKSKNFSINKKENKENNNNENLINNNKENLLLNSDIENIDENIINDMEKNYGYKKDYIKRCIMSKEINYCYATYFLLLNSSK